MSDKRISALAPAKINLALHVTGRRDDGYHLLEMEVAFADAEAADTVTVSKAEDDVLSVTGPFAETLLAQAGKANLVDKARDVCRTLAQAEGHNAFPVRIVLDKKLPVASGIGGGSADAAATIKALARLWNLDLSNLPGFKDAALSLGADVPMCLVNRPLRARGIGDEISTRRDVPALPTVLINPLLMVPTQDVFSALVQRQNPGLPILSPEATRNASEFARWLRLKTRNDLQNPATSLQPAIATVLSALAKSNAIIARMSGSGGTCFGLFGSTAEAEAAAKTIAEENPEWWVRTTVLSAHDGGKGTKS